MRGHRTRCLVASITLATGVLSAVAPAASAEPGPERTEQAVAIPGVGSDVRESVVRVKVPLPDSAGPHPPACDWLSYLRYRDANGPRTSADADRILIAQPGVLEGASAFDTVARNTIAAAAQRGQHVEFWALDRRSNCLEDHTGTDAAVAAAKPDVAVGYYYRGESIDGGRFDGYRSGPQLKWLSAMGIEQTVRDQYDLMVAELPDKHTRQDKVLCGGHSLGGAVTAYFAQWDFDGDPGYGQCAGYFALDSAISPNLPFALKAELAALISDVSDADSVRAAVQSGIVPASVNAPALINPETMNLLAIAGAAAQIAPEDESPLLHLQDTNIDASLRILFSRSIGQALQPGEVAIRNVRLTNTAALASLLDNNSQPLAFLQAAMGFYTGGPVADKDFPIPNALNLAERPLTASLLGPNRYVVPTAYGPLYGWNNYDQLPADLPSAPDGHPYTSPDKEVTDITQLARSLADHPLDFTEQYFPTVLLAETVLGPTHLQSKLEHPEGLTVHHTIDLIGGSGLAIGTEPRSNGTVGKLTTVIAPGYHHLDVLTADARQNNNRPEPISTALADFAIDQR
ncbi:hypothetical protein AB0M22_37660 [Nocardia sp. NPDC051756]|uniref:hypothetical protein n=1 Tax=Nocardia sp. NPDC051756 TaxID=3154751 RepID=UPI003434D53D